MTDGLEELRSALMRPGAVAPADGLAVEVTSVTLVPNPDVDPDDPHHWTEEIEIRYAVPPLPDGIASLPGGWTDVSEADHIAEELQGWAIGHVRRHRPPAPLDPEVIRGELPSREELWELLAGNFDEAREEPTGLAVEVDGEELHLIVTRGQWQDYVVRCEIGCRNDYGIDARQPGQGPGWALFYLDEVIATKDEDESFVVYSDGEFGGSTRAELPPVPGMARDREHAAVMARIAAKRAANPDAKFGWFAYSPDEPRPE